MWWEKFLLWAVILEKSVLYPLIFLSAVYQDKGVFSDLFGLWGGSMLMSICLLKSLRLVFFIWGGKCKKTSRLIRSSTLHKSYACSLLPVQFMLNFLIAAVYVNYTIHLALMLDQLLIIARAVSYIEK